MVEAMMSLTLVDHLMMQQAQCELFENESEDINPMGTTARRLTERQHAVASSGPVSQRIDEE